jgi:hypothetical protein
MAYNFGNTSQARLDTCHPLLQELANEAIKYIDFSIICGHRPKEDQDAAFFAVPQVSKVQWPNSKHNSSPSKAMDVAPYPIDWKDIKRFAYLMGILKGIAMTKGIKVRTGVDWDRDGDITDHNFMDWPHIELVLDE